MDIILYNPLSRNGKSIDVVRKLEKILTKKNKEHITVNLLEIINIKEFISNYNEHDRFIIIGGDGTLNRLVNSIRGIEVRSEVFIYKAGTGNDFVRSLKVKNKNNLIDIKKYLENLPTVTIKDEELLFLNGIGLGIDGLVCHYVNNSRGKKNKYNYFKNALKGFKDYTPKISKVIIDGKEITVNKTWLVSVLNSKFLGGGMRFAPKADRTSDIMYVLIAQKAPRWIVGIIFPSIYLGLHKLFRRYVKLYPAKEVEIIFEQETYLQIDGEDFNSINSVVVKKEKQQK